MAFMAFMALLFLFNGGGGCIGDVQVHMLRDGYLQRVALFIDIRAAVCFPTFLFFIKNLWLLVAIKIRRKLKIWWWGGGEGMGGGGRVYYVVEVGLLG